MYTNDGTVPYIMEGQVVATDDPDQMGRVRVWIPALDGEDFVLENLPWTEYASPFLGFTVDYPAGGQKTANAANAAYGFWAIPKIGATVLVFCLNADPGARYYFACTPRLHKNRSLPAGRNADPSGMVGPFGDSWNDNGQFDKLQPAFDNLRAQFQNKLGSSQALTRGSYERQVAQPATDKDGSEGYSANPADPSYLDPQTYCLVTPGRNAIIMQDDPRYARLRLKTADGHQVIFDDANERIYISTALGRSWVELDTDGHINIYGGDSISIRSGQDVNIFADRNINLEAGESVNIKANKKDIRMATGGDMHIRATGGIYQTACGNFDITSEKTVHLKSSSGLNLSSGQSLLMSAESGGVDMFCPGMARISAARLEIPKNTEATDPTVDRASGGKCPSDPLGPSVVPAHEPWKRPMSKYPRGRNWRE